MTDSSGADRKKRMGHMPPQERVLCLGWSGPVRGGGVSPHTRCLYTHTLGAYQ